MRTLMLAALVFFTRCEDAPSVPYTTYPESGVRREVFRVAGVHAPDHPSGLATPAEFEETTVVRYRRDTPNPSPAEAIIIAMPGFLAGANTFDGLARTLVRRAAQRDGSIEVWAIDRRANLLEDTFGLDEAEANQDPEIADRYYNQLQTIRGHKFTEKPDPATVQYMSEWGLGVHVEDLHRVLELIPAANRKQSVFLLGHSLGGSFVEAYAAWQFQSDQHRGADDVAGLIMIDGILGDSPVPESQYTGGSTVPFPSPGLTAVRDGAPYTELPILGAGALITADIVALRAFYDPLGVIDDPVRDYQFKLLFSYSGATPHVTNRAALGLAFDSEHEPLPFVRATVGKLIGPSEAFTSLFSTSPLLRPADPTMTYDFTSGPTQPDEFSSLNDLAFAMVHGRGNLSEWYFPTRLSLDLAAVGGGTIPMTGYPATYGLRTFAGDQNDAPVLCIAAELVGDVTRCDAIRGRIAPTLGTGRTRAGADRGTAGQSVPGFRVLDVTTMAHIDPVLAADTSWNPVPAAIEGFLAEHRGGSLVIVPRQPSP